MSLVHRDNLQWLEQCNKPLSDIPIQIIEELLVKSPALETTVQSDGFISRFSVADSDDAEVLFQYLLNGVAFYASDTKRYASSADEVERLLSDHGLVAGDFWQSGEFAVYTVPSKAITQVNHAVEQLCASNTSLKEQKKTLIKDKYLQVDALFRHIRNSFAHGAFQIKTVDGEKYLILQGCNTNGYVSSRMVLKTSRFESWITDFYRFERKGV